MDTQINQDILSRTEVAKYLRVSVGFVSKLIKDHKLPATRTTKGFLIKKSDLDEFIERCRVPARPPQERN